jgi:benzoyl-CoA reductase/2-hydroxyglutaryl-CoA dehydratase subunit BcrC/BadD/HgdB
MEEKLKSLIEAGNWNNRVNFAREWKAKGGKVIGIMDSLVPEEVIYAAGMLPWRIQGTWQGDVSRAMVYRLPQSCDFLSHVLESVLEGELDFLDGMVCSNRDEDFLRFCDYWDELSNIRFMHVLDVPIINTELSRKRFTTVMENFINTVGEFGNVKIDDSSLRYAIVTYNKGRTLLKKMYELRKKQVPPVTGGEALAITLSAMVMPRDEFNSKLESLLPYLNERKANIANSRPRLLLSSDLMDNPAYIDLVEKTGCLVAMDDMDTGSRYFWETVDIEKPVDGLVKRYLNNRSPRMLDWQEQVEQLLRWTEEYHIDGILDLPDVYDYPRGFRKPFFEKHLKEKEIPLMSFMRDYPLAQTGQLSTRIGAFIEMLETETTA